MARSRSRRRRNRWFIAVLAFVVLILFITASVMYVNYIYSDERKKEADILQRAQQEVPLTEVNGIEKSIWDEVVYVINGVNQEGKAVWVWVFPDRVTSIPVADSVDKDTVKANIYQAYSDARIVRLLPGYKDNQYVWQAFVQRKDEKGTRRYFYQFYSFSDGSPLGEIYGLPNQ
ncbi:DUF5590 domain-containing protein [Paenibacillus dendritiformis]|uniref:cell wall elongation regulator TseB-like domain-containing protein n=1 Tax=Paenibacillus dendritiformis TaxID=130049 RepID=UPI000DA786D6|nr:DUF5590 domain-containing protein [Paenibacillus dendritiformis]PZM65525.1 hypothetical protein DOE73_11105 [Paenibacillus dendritiformis]